MVLVSEQQWLRAIIAEHLINGSPDHVAVSRLPGGWRVAPLPHPGSANIGASDLLITDRGLVGRCSRACTEFEAISLLAALEAQR